MRKYKKLFAASALLLAALSLALSVFGTDTLPGKDLMTDLESAIDGIESDLMGTGDAVTTTPTTTAPTTTSPSLTTSPETTGGEMTDGGGAVGLVVGICVAVIALIVVFVILTRSRDQRR